MSVAKSMANFQAFRSLWDCIAYDTINQTTKQQNNQTTLIFIISSLNLDYLILKWFLHEDWSCLVVALVFPSAYVEEVLVITLCLAFLCLVLLTEVTATGLLTVEGVVSDELTHDDEVA